MVVFLVNNMRLVALLLLAAAQPGRSMEEFPKIVIPRSCQAMAQEELEFGRAELQAIASLLDLDSADRGVLIRGQFGGTPRIGLAIEVKGKWTVATLAYDLKKWKTGLRGRETIQICIDYRPDPVECRQICDAARRFLVDPKSVELPTDSDTAHSSMIFIKAWDEKGANNLAILDNYIFAPLPSDKADAKKTGEKKDIWPEIVHEDLWPEIGRLLYSLLRQCEE